ncbi:hypothetical protein C8Q74DRAFT_78867 [Fomes fomentarius]|nr:hypothetical protein C8Q74DRAFT_78867 [Fomes fomentarius]
MRSSRRPTQSNVIQRCSSPWKVWASFSAIKTSSSLGTTPRHACTRRPDCAAVAGSVLSKQHHDSLSAGSVVARGMVESGDGASAHRPRTISPATCALGAAAGTSEAGAFLFRLRPPRVHSGILAGPEAKSAARGAQGVLAIRRAGALV